MFGAPRDENVNSRILLAFRYLHVRIKIRVTTFDTKHFVTDSTLTVAASIQQLPDSAVKRLSTAGSRLSGCVGRNNQLIERFEGSC